MMQESWRREGSEGARRRRKEGQMTASHQHAVSGQDGLLHLQHYLAKRGPPQPEELAGPSAVLVLLAPVDGVLKVLLIQRAAALRHHAGQMAFVGGGFEPGDDTLWGTALREAREEVGLDAATVDELRPIGILTPVAIAVSGYTVLPWVALASAVPVLAADVREVARVLWASVDELVQCEALVPRPRAGGPPQLWPEFVLPVGRVWGATALMLDELLFGLSGGQPGAWRFLSAVTSERKG
jgi:8-oxo-dGTP pyrophosphatase MutT (NUDIX family)